MNNSIAILGDFNPAYSTHIALNSSIGELSTLLDEPLQFDWIGTDIFKAADLLPTHYCGLWIAPGSPYKNMQNVLDSISYARGNNIPTLGNCGGFQHMIIEFARNVCGIALADHEETNPESKELLISKLSCSLVAQEERLLLSSKDSILYRIIQQEYVQGKYFCSYGVNENYTDLLSKEGILFTAYSADGQPRAFELKCHPFYVGTLFQPALTSTAEKPDPIIVAFVKQCIDLKKAV